MLYMAECRFTDPAQEEAWNAWYGGPRLDELLSVPGFLTSQRFKAVTPADSPYLAIHTIDSPAVFASSAYHAVSGGGFKGWQRYIDNWRRTLFTGMEAAPAIGIDEYLVLIDAGGEDIGAGPITWLRNAGLDNAIAQRGLARTDSAVATELMSRQRHAVTIYQPMMPQKLARWK